jgi:hypothetical protein
MVARSFNGRSKAMAVIIGCYTEMRLAIRATVFAPSQKQ